MPVDIKINEAVVQKLRQAFSDPSYKEIIESAASTNTRIKLERKMRLPFLDQQTRLAQSDCNLWMQKWQRMPGKYEGQLYSYPTSRWRKKRRQYLLNDKYAQAAAAAAAAAASAPKEADDIEMHHISVVENVAATNQSDASTPDEKSNLSLHDAKGEDSNQSWYRELEDSVNDPMDSSAMDFLDEPESEGDDCDGDYAYGSSSRRRKKRPNTKKSKRTRVDYADSEKPYVCDVCGVRYKTRPGLSYHYAHSHSGTSAPPETPGHSPSPSSSNQGLPQGYPPSTAGGTTSAAPRSTGSSGDNSPLAGLRKFQDNFLSFLKTPGQEGGGPGSKPEGGASSTLSVGGSGEGTASSPRQGPDGTKTTGQAPSQYCDFCLGDAAENKKTNQPEELVSCSDCGRSAHPSCLQFTPNMTKSVRKYKWQCIECKSCGLCGTSDNDDQLLFCDDCDRGYHMYCLNPPLSEPPEGSWSCHLCVIEYGKK